jgi:hypothetical protein
MVWPLLEHWIATFGLYFRTIIIETLPHDPPWLNTPRRVLIAKDKRVEGDLTPVSVTHTPAVVAYTEAIAPTPGIMTPTEPVAPVEPAPAVEAAPQVEPVAPVEPMAPVEPSAPVVAEGPVRFGDLPIRHIAKKMRPWRLSFWRSAARHGVRRIRQSPPPAEQA